MASKDLLFFLALRHLTSFSYSERLTSDATDRKTKTRPSNLFCVIAYRKRPYTVYVSINFSFENAPSPLLRWMTEWNKKTQLLQRHRNALHICQLWSCQLLTYATIRKIAFEKACNGPMTLSVTQGHRKAVVLCHFLLVICSNKSLSCTVSEILRLLPCTWLPVTLRSPSVSIGAYDSAN